MNASGSLRTLSGHCHNLFNTKPLVLNQELLRKYWIYLVPLVLLVLHIPFLYADPDIYLSMSRDAHTDEGLNTSQVRNFVNGHGLHPWECDNLVKNPLFNVFLVTPLWAFGTELPVARLTVLVFCLAIMTAILRKKQHRNWALIFSAIVLLQYHIFQYMHFSMAEMCGTFCILASLVWVNDYLLTRQNKALIWACIFSLCTWWFKIQFAYWLPALPAILIIDLVYRWIRGRKLPVLIFRKSLWAAGIFIAGGILYYLLWYLPLKAPFTYIILNQTSGRMSDAGIFGVHFMENYRRLFFTPELMPLLYATALCSIAGVIMVFVHKAMKNRILFGLSLLWCLIEVHKLLIMHVPSRYMVSAYMAMGMLCAVIFAEFLALYVLSRSGDKRYRVMEYMALMGIVTGLFLLYSHGTQYSALYERREFDIRDMNRFFRENTTQKDVVVGSWSPCATWGSKCRAVPVWKEYLNDKNILQTFHPKYIVTERREEESNGAYIADGIRLQEMQREPVTYVIGRTAVVIYKVQ